MKTAYILNIYMRSGAVVTTVLADIKITGQGKIRAFEADYVNQDAFKRIREEYHQYDLEFFLLNWCDVKDFLMVTVLDWIEIQDSDTTAGEKVEEPKEEEKDE